MADRISVIIAVPVDPALPVDVQGVGLRRKAIEAMQEVANIDENTVRYKQASIDATVSLGEGNHLSLWQHNLLGAVFYADGKADPEIVGSVVHSDPVTRISSAVSVVRNEFD